MDMNNNNETENNRQQRSDRFNYSVIITNPCADQSAVQILQDAEENTQFTRDISLETQKLIKHRKGISKTALSYVTNSFRNLVDGIIEVASSEKTLEVVDLTDTARPSCSEKAESDNKLVEYVAPKPRNRQWILPINSSAQVRPMLYLKDSAPAMSIPVQMSSLPMKPIEIPPVIQTPPRVQKPRYKTYQNRKKEKSTGMPYDLANFNNIQGPSNTFATQCHVNPQQYNDHSVNMSQHNYMVQRDPRNFFYTQTHIPQLTGNEQQLLAYRRQMGNYRDSNACNYFGNQTYQN